MLRLRCGFLGNMFRVFYVGLVVMDLFVTSVDAQQATRNIRVVKENMGYIPSQIFADTVKTARHETHMKDSN